ncbi:hypothetical protein [Simonsiella muelleri]|uniref:hypothetical protein n=1 Tax=Simonsiella muelleri TaxID=72 RepID=UPI0002E79B82|nr:hypothetical protein [Simonsiella muelleri]
MTKLFFRQPETFFWSFKIKNTTALFALLIVLCVHRGSVALSYFYYNHQDRLPEK